MSVSTSLHLLTRYKAWANELIFSAVNELPAGEATRERPTRFKNMVHTLNHVYVIDRIFQAHLEGTEHGYSARNTPSTPTLKDLWDKVRELDAWYIDLSDRITVESLMEPVHFKFVDGGDGCMTREQMIVHVINHGTYHRGFVGDMMYQVPVMPPATDLPVFVRDAYRS